VKDLDDIREQLQRIETALIGDPLDQNAPPGMVDCVQEHGRRIKAIETKHRRVVGWALAGIGTVVAGALYSMGTYMVELVKGGQHTPGGH